MILISKSIAKRHFIVNEYDVISYNCMHLVNINNNTCFQYPGILFHTIYNQGWIKSKYII